MLPCTPNDRFNKKKSCASVFDAQKFVTIDTSKQVLEDIQVPDDHPTYKSIKLSAGSSYAQIVFQNKSKYAGEVLIEKGSQKLGRLSISDDGSASHNGESKKKFFSSKSQEDAVDLLFGGLTPRTPSASGDKSTTDEPNVTPTSAVTDASSQASQSPTTTAAPFDVNLDTLYLNGMGELHFFNGDRYSGSFHKNKRCGYGIMIHKRERIQYYGQYREDFKDGCGVCIYRDGSVYDGNWQQDKRHGSGTFKLSNGYIIQGQWVSDDIANAQFIPMTSFDEASKCSNIILRQQTETLNDVKFCYFSPNMSEKRYPQQMLCGRKWDGFFLSKHEIIKMEALAFKQDIVQDNPDNITKLSIKVFVKRPNSFLTACVDEFIKIFHFRYNVITEYTAQLHKPHALDDLLSFVNQLFDVYENQIVGEYAHVFSDFYYFLKDYVLAKTYELLISIYRLVYKEQDDDIDLRLESLQNTTLRDMGVAKDFIPQIDEDVEAYTQPILTLRNLEKETLPSKKFELLIRVKEQASMAMIHVRTQINKLSKQKDIGADDSVPVYIYIFFKAAIPFAYSELKYCIDLQDNRQRHSAAENAYTSIIELPVEFVLKTDWNIRDENGFLTQSSMLEAQLDRKVQEVCKQAKKDSTFDEKTFRAFMKGCYIQISNTLSIAKGESTPFDEKYSPNFVAFRSHMEPILESTGLKLKKEANKYRIEFEKPYPTYVYFQLAKVFLQ